MYIFMFTTIWEGPEVNGKKEGCGKKRRVEDGI